MKVYQIYDQATDAYTAWAAQDEQDAIVRYVRENPPDLTVQLIATVTNSLVEGTDDVARFPVEDWQREIADGDTRLGYIEWLAAKLNTDWEGL